MPEAGEHCIEIERPADEVFAFAAALENAPRWLSGVLEVSPLGAGGAGLAPSPGASAGITRPGRRYQALLRRPGGGARPLRFGVEVFLPGKLVVFQAEAPLPLRLLVAVKRRSARRSRICWRGGLPPGRWPERALLAALRGAAESRYAHRSLQRLKLLLELAPAMRAAQVRRFGAPAEVLELASAAPLPAPGPREVLVRVAASSVNPVDLARMGGYGQRVFAAGPGGRLPMIPGRDLCGVVVATGARARRFCVGDAVWGATGPAAAGAWAEFAAVAESALAPKPASLSDEQAAALPYAALTAWAALVGRLGLNPRRARGRRVLVHAGAGGIGSFAIQLLAAWGAHVATTCSARNAELVRGLGAAEVIDHSRENFAERLAGFDYALDTLGGAAAAPTRAILRRGVPGLGTGGYVSVVHPLLAALDRHGPLRGGLLAAALLLRGKLAARLRGQGYHWAVFRPDGAALAEIGRMVAAGRIRPVVDCVLPLEQIGEAVAHVASRRARGKVVVRIQRGPVRA